MIVGQTCDLLKLHVFSGHDAAYLKLWKLLRRRGKVRLARLFSSISALYDSPLRWSDFIEGSNSFCVRLQLRTKAATLKPTSNNLMAHREKILASLACYSHTSNRQISLTPTAVYQSSHSLSMTGSGGTQRYYWHACPTKIFVLNYKYKAYEPSVKSTDHWCDD